MNAAPSLPSPLPLSRIIFGEPGPSQRMAPLAIAVALAIHAVAGGIAWWRDVQPIDTVPCLDTPKLQLDELIEIELPRPKPAPIAKAPPPPPLPKPLPQPPQPVLEAKPKPIVQSPRVIPPKKAKVRHIPREKQVLPAQAAQVVRQSDENTATTETFDMVQGSGPQYAGGVTSATGTSKKAVREVVVSYQELLLAMIERHKRYPRNALRRRIEGRPILEIRLDRSGKLLDFQVTQSSRHGDLDAAALAMVQRAQPFPPVPPDYTEPTFVFSFGIDFNIGR